MSNYSQRIILLARSVTALAVVQLSVLTIGHAREFRALSKQERECRPYDRPTTLPVLCTHPFLSWATTLQCFYLCAIEAIFSNTTFSHMYCHTPLVTCIAQYVWESKHFGEMYNWCYTKHGMVYNTPIQSCVTNSCA
jgi:hypothetical protein